MTIGRMIFVLGGCLVLGLISGIVTRNLLVAIAFPFLLVIFILMWVNLRKDIKDEKEDIEVDKEDIANSGVNDINTETQQSSEGYTPPPVSTNYPSKPY